MKTKKCLGKQILFNEKKGLGKHILLSEKTTNVQEIKKTKNQKKSNLGQRPAMGC